MKFNRLTLISIHAVFIAHAALLNEVIKAYLRRAYEIPGKNIRFGNVFCVAAALGRRTVSGS